MDWWMLASLLDLRSGSNRCWDWRGFLLLLHSFYYDPSHIQLRIFLRFALLYLLQLSINRLCFTYSRTGHFHTELHRIDCDLLPSVETVHKSRPWLDKILRGKQMLWCCALICTWGIQWIIWKRFSITWDWTSFYSFIFTYNAHHSHMCHIQKQMWKMYTLLRRETPWYLSIAK